jgi:putative RecB family exonuclease
LRLRGIIDRLELDDDGELVVTDYKTGSVPHESHEQARLGGVQFYALLCERLFGRRPARVQLLYLKEPTAIIATPTEQSTRGLERKVRAIWSAIERACEHESFKPRTSRLCDWCAFKAYCPAWGGDPDAAREQLVELQSAETALPVAS